MTYICTLRIPPCLRQDYCSTDNITPFIIEKGVRYSETEGMVVLIYNIVNMQWLYNVLPLVTTDEPKERIIDEDVHNTNNEITENREDS